MDSLDIVCSLIVIAALATFARFTILFKNIRRERRRDLNSDSVTKGPFHTCVVIGSGGHTSEMLRLVGPLSKCYAPRHYVMADTDQMSEQRVQTFESSVKSGKDRQYYITKVPRSREVGQSWFSTVLSVLYASCFCFPLIWKSKPDLILCNGPGTCIPLCIAGFILKVLCIKNTKIVYVESICRVDTMSLSGRILYYFADQIIVQWPQLQKQYPLTRYLGRVV